MFGLGVADVGRGLRSLKGRIARAGVNQLSKAAQDTSPKPKSPQPQLLTAWAESPPQSSPDVIMSPLSKGLYGGFYGGDGLSIVGVIRG